MSGQELYGYYVSQGGEYAQTLLTAYSHHREKVFSFLEEGEKTGKKIKLVETMEGVLDPPLKMVLT